MEKVSTYQKKLLDPRWQKKRLEIFNRDNFTCTSCGSSKNTLHIHHLSYNKNPWDVDNNQLKTLCEYCHELYEKFKFPIEIKKIRTKEYPDFNVVCYNVYLKENDELKLFTYHASDGKLVSIFGMRMSTLIEHSEILLELQNAR